MVGSQLPSWRNPAVKREIGGCVRPFHERSFRQHVVLLAVFRPVKSPGILPEARVLVEADFMETMRAYRDEGVCGASKKNTSVLQ